MISTKLEESMKEANTNNDAMSSKYGADLLSYPIVRSTVSPWVDWEAVRFINCDKKNRSVRTVQIFLIPKVGDIYFRESTDIVSP